MAEGPAHNVRNVTAELLRLTNQQFPDPCRPLAAIIELIRNLLLTIDFNHLEDMPVTTLTELQNALYEARSIMRDVITKSFPAGQIPHPPGVVPPYAHELTQANVNSWRGQLERHHATIYQLAGSIIAQQQARLAWVGVPPIKLSCQAGLQAESECRIWRYMPLKNLLRCERGSGLWMSSIGSLRQWSSEGMADVQESDIPPVIAKLKRDYQEATGKGKPAMARFLDEHALTAQQVDKLSGFILDPARERNTTFVSSWIKKSAESAAMWSLYGDHGRGIAVGATIGRLVECDWRTPIDLSGINGPACVTALILREVVYLEFDERDKLPNLDDFHLALLKRSHFEDEHELRIVAFTSAPLPRSGFPLHCNLRDVIGEIIVGPQADFDETRGRIEHSAADLRGIEIRQSKISPQSIRG